MNKSKHEHEDIDDDFWFPYFYERVQEETREEPLTEIEIKQKALYLTRVHRQLLDTIIARHAEERPDEFDFSVPAYVNILTDCQLKEKPSKPGDIVKERLKIDWQGKVELSQNCYDDGIRYPSVVLDSTRIDAEPAGEMLYRISSVLSSYPPDTIPRRGKIPRAGEWFVYLHDAYGCTLRFVGHYGNDFEFMGMTISDFIRKTLKVEELMLFSGKKSASE